MFVLSMPILAKRRSEVQRLIRAFLASALFVYLGAFWHLYNYAILGRYVTGIPFWKVYTRSEHVIEYIEAEATFAQFPRFRLPFSSPAGTGLFLALEGIFLVALSLLDISRLKRRGLMLIVLNLINLFCLLGTFARTSWLVFCIGCLIVLLSLKRVGLVTFSKITFGVLVYIATSLILVASIPVARDLSYMVGLRLSPYVTEASDVGHLESRLLALKYWTESPVIGIGVGGFWTRPLGGIHTHSTYFTIFVERGVVGLLLFLAFLMQILRAILKEVRSIGEHSRERGTPYSVAFLAGIVGLMIGGLLYEINCEMVWMFLALALSWINAAREAEPARNKSEVLITDTRKGIMQQALTRSVP
jgi:O-antigen ligase